MKQLLTCTAVALVLATPAAADVTLRQVVKGKGLGLSGQTTGVTYIRGLRMRSDVKIRDRVQTTIFDLEAQKMYVFDSRKKEAEVWDIAAFSTELSKTLDSGQMTVSLDTNGQTRQIGGRAATGYDLEISVPVDNDGMPMIVTLSGPMWIVKGAPGTSDYLRFYRAAAERGWILSDPRAAKGSPAQARTMTEMHHRLAETGGIAYETSAHIKLRARGNNPLGGLLARIGTITAATIVESVETTPLSDELFAPPAGYKLKPKK